MQLLLSCNTKVDRLEQALQNAKGNRVELDKVLSHFKRNSDDTLKYRAACFLIENMPGHFSYDTTHLDIYRKIWETRDSLKHNNPTADMSGLLKDKWNQLKARFPLEQMIYSNPVKVDLQTLKSEMLIDRIDQAYKTWIDNPYSDSITVNNFLEYVLPYRTKDGEFPESYRDVFCNRHSAWIKSHSTLPVTELFDSILFKYQDFVHFWYLSDYPYLKNSDFMISKLGLCDHRCHFNAKLFSSLGFPVSVDFVPAWGNRDVGHTWNALLYGGKTYAFESFWDKERWKYKTIYNNVDVDQEWGAFRLPKVFRNTFSYHANGPIADTRVNTSDIPQLFQNTFQVDVSKEYFETVDLKTDLTAPIPPETYYAYLCVFNSGLWRPIQWGKINGHTVCFPQMGKGIVYLPAFYREGEVIPAGPAFILHPDDHLEYLRSGNAKQSVLLTRKYPKHCANEAQENDRCKLWVGCKIYAANKADFSDEIVLHELTNPPGWGLNAEPIKSENKYRYVRFKVSPLMCHKIAEIKLTSNEPATLVPLIIKSGGIEKEQILKAFDNNCLTYMETNNTSSQFNSDSVTVVLDYKKAILFRDINIVSYYDDNNIFPDTEYELSYWDDRWISLGTVRSTSLNVTFNQVPVNVLLRLNRTDNSSTKSRIFTYEGKKQIWW